MCSRQECAHPPGCVPIHSLPQAFGALFVCRQTTHGVIWSVAHQLLFFSQCWLYPIMCCLVPQLTFPWSSINSASERETPRVRHNGWEAETILAHNVVSYKGPPRRHQRFGRYVVFVQDICKRWERHNVSWHCVLQ